MFVFMDYTYAYPAMNKDKIIRHKRYDRHAVVAPATYSEYLERCEKLDAAGKRARENNITWTRRRPKKLYVQRQPEMTRIYNRPNAGISHLAVRHNRMASRGYIKERSLMASSPGIKPELSELINSRGGSYEDKMASSPEMKPELSEFSSGQGGSYEDNLEDEAVEGTKHVPMADGIPPITKHSPIMERLSYKKTDRRIIFPSIHQDGNQNTCFVSRDICYTKGNQCSIDGKVKVSITKLSDIKWMTTKSSFVKNLPSVKPRLPKIAGIQKSSKCQGSINVKERVKFTVSAKTFFTTTNWQDNLRDNQDKPLLWIGALRNAIELLVLDIGLDSADNSNESTKWSPYDSERSMYWSDDDSEKSIYLSDVDSKESIYWDIVCYLLHGIDCITCNINVPRLDLTTCSNGILLVLARATEIHHKDWKPVVLELIQRYSSQLTQRNRMKQIPLHIAASRSGQDEYNQFLLLALLEARTCTASFVDMQGKFAFEIALHSQYNWHQGLNKLYHSCPVSAETCTHPLWVKLAIFAQYIKCGHLAVAMHKHRQANKHYKGDSIC